MICTEQLNDSSETDSDNDERDPGTLDLVQLLNSEDFDGFVKEKRTEKVCPSGFYVESYCE